MFTRNRPGPANDLGQTGDPWQTGTLSDAPNPAEREAWVEQYDQNVAAALAVAGIGPDDPNYDAHLRVAIDNDMTHHAGLEHGAELPMRKRDAIQYAPEGDWQEQRIQAERGNAMLAEYQRRYPDLHGVEGLDEAVAGASEYFADRGQRPSDDYVGFLGTVAAFHRGRVGPIHADAGRTSGVGSGSGPTLPSFPHPDDADAEGGTVDVIRDMQRRGGFY